MEIIDAQIHEPKPPIPLGGNYGKDVELLVNTEIAREAMDSVGVDAALVFARQEYIDSCVGRYPNRFGGVLVFDHMAPDLEERIANYRKKPGNLAGRNLVGNAATAELRPEYAEGKFDRYWEYAAKYELPLFFSTHGWSHVMEPVAQKYPNLTMIIDHLGVSQSPVSPPREDKWDRLPGVLGLAKYPNVHVKFSGVPLMSESGKFPYEDTWPFLHKIIEAFTPDRLLWGTDFTRMRWIPQTSSELRPFKEWKYYSDCVSYLRDTNELSESDKEKMFGKTVRRVLRWPKPAAP
jgi:predicted TIM-barrel fold metal-dependent hydrolase